MEVSTEDTVKARSLNNMQLEVRRQGLCHVGTGFLVGTERK